MKKIIIMTIIFLSCLITFCIFINIKMQSNVPNSAKSKEFVKSKKSDIEPNTPEKDIIEQTEKEDDTPIHASGYNSNTSSNTSINNNDKKESKSNSNNKTTKSSNAVPQTQPQTSTQQQVVQQPQAPAPKPQTEWDKLGISEYEYYNTPLHSWEEVDYKNMSECEAKARSINQQYGYTTNYGNTLGKYTYNTIGCWVMIYVNGQGYYLHEFERLGL